MNTKEAKANKGYIPPPTGVWSANIFAFRENIVITLEFRALFRQSLGMKQKDVIQTLKANLGLLKTFSVKSLSVFGSTVRGEAIDSSDVDLLVEFEDDAHIGLFQFIELKQSLEGILHCPVDLGTPDTLRSPIREQALREAIRVA